MADAVTLEQLLGVIVVAMGGKEGIAALVKKFNNKKSDFVTKEFCGERHRTMENLLDEVRVDVKNILKQLGSGGGQ